MKHIDKVFKDKLYHQTAEVPANMWDKIAPAIEEKSGRGLLWFWLAGIATLLIGGLAYYYLTNNTDTNTAPTGPLAENITTLAAHSKTPQEKIAANTNQLQVTATNETLEKEIIAEAVINPTVSVKTKPAAIKAVVKTSPIVSKNTKVSEKVTSPEMKYGKPANLVITKSYISKEGSFIEKSNLSNRETDTEAGYNVFINNSEGLNAGALMRIVEPLENIPLPAFEKVLKKKTLIHI